MIQLENTLVSSEIKERFFVCNLDKCKGACCVEGDLGAPLEKDELPMLEEVVDVVKPYLSKEAVEALEKHGPYLLDEEGDFSTTTIDNKECAFAYYDDQKILKCGIEQAWKDGKTEFQKPISCHLYPIRVAKLHEFLALNYDRWDICSPACDLGAELAVPVYKFLEGALVRRFGQSWYDKLCLMIEKGEDTEEV
ncbi:DUF3109 family protein [Marinoscillum pacificum]|uniref:DUF3109 family protein n=1 Tax=Marinoscillum pacificum TaxID=392723 RepID=UPI0021573AAD|nr:DUF3109 family protein [Marinoscillum pacificum]